MELQKRKVIRLKSYDYSQNGAYFITICVKDKHQMLWKQSVGADIIRPQDNENLSEYGLVVEDAIKNMTNHYHNVVIDKYVIMPNHIHIILILTFKDGRIISAPTKDLSVIIGQMKRYVSKEVGFSLWQKSFHDHIIRNEKEYQEIWQYIDQNPLKWKDDCYHI